MKVSVSLPDEDIEFLDSYAASVGMNSRSAALHRAVRLLKEHELSDDYEAAWRSGRTRATTRWDQATNDGLVTSASR